MSVTYNTPFKKPECSDAFNLGGDVTQGYLRDVIGGMINLQAVGTDPDLVQPVDGLNMISDYVPTQGNVNPDGTFFIIPLSDAQTYAVVLADGNQFLITTEMSTAYLGQIIPLRLLRVLADNTTGYFSIVW